MPSLQRFGGSHGSHYAPDPELCGTHFPHLCEEAVKKLLSARQVGLPTAGGCSPRPEPGLRAITG